MTELPLENVRVLDLSQVYAGPTCSRLLADLGAEVIKIEGISRIDVIRNLILLDNNTQDDYWNRSGYFLCRNAGKKSLTLDLTREAGRELFLRLVPQTDVVLESFTPRVMRQMGLHYEALCQIKPDLIMLSMSGYGQTGPWANYTAFGMGLEPASGISSLTGYRDGPPLRSGISFTDPLTGMMGAGAVLAALHYRRRTGKGQYIDLSEHEAAIPLVGYALMDYVMNGRLPRRIGNRSPWFAPQGSYRCRPDESGDDNWLVLTVRNDDEWRAFCQAVGQPQWAKDEHFADVLGRIHHHDELDELIGAWSRERDHIEAMHLLQRAGIIAAAVLNPKEVLFDPHLRERGYWDMAEQPGAGRRPMARQLGARFSDMEPGPRGHAPKLGEHNHEILSGLLGLSEEELEGLKEEKVIGDAPETVVPLAVMRQALQQPLSAFLQMGAFHALEDDYKKQLGIEAG